MKQISFHSAFTALFVVKHLSAFLRFYNLRPFYLSSIWGICSNPASFFFSNLWWWSFIEHVMHGKDIFILKLQYTWQQTWIFPPAYLTSVASFNSLALWWNSKAVSFVKITRNLGMHPAERLGYLTLSGKRRRESKYDNTTK